MILPDVNVLVYAFRREAERHEAYASWLGEVVGGAEELALHDPVLSGFLRLVTSPRVVADPAPMPVALTFVERLLDATSTRWVSGGRTSWRRFRGLADGDPRLRGTLVPDAHVAAVALAHGARVATADRGFARYPGLRWFDPAPPG